MTGAALATRVEQLACASSSKLATEIVLPRHQHALKKEHVHVRIEREVLKETIGWYALRHHKIVAEAPTPSRQNTDIPI